MKTKTGGQWDGYAEGRFTYTYLRWAGIKGNKVTVTGK
jgi:hypothetical protein